MNTLLLSRDAHQTVRRCACSYEEQLSLGKLRMVLEERLEDYNMEPKLVSMQLVLFKVILARKKLLRSAW